MTAGNRTSHTYASELDVLSACDALKATKLRRGHATKAEQLNLPLWG